MDECSVDLLDLIPYQNTIFTGATSSDDLFSILETLEDGSVQAHPFHHFGQSTILRSSDKICEELMLKTIDANREERRNIGKKRKISTMDESTAAQNAPHKTSHITVERNRRKQMNEHLSVLRSLMPRFYVKRGDQASIIGGVVDYIKELEQLLQSLEAKKQRKMCSEVLSPRPAFCPRLLPLSPTPSSFSPKLGLPISPRTPLPESPYKRYILGSYIASRLVLPVQLAAYPFSENANKKSCLELGMVSCSTQAMADVTVEFSGPNVILKTISKQIPGQVLKIVAALESLSLEILQASIRIVDGTLFNSFIIKIGVECDLSAEDLVQEIKHTFC